MNVHAGFLGGVPIEDTEALPDVPPVDVRGHLMMKAYHSVAPVLARFTAGLPA